MKFSEAIRLGSMLKRQGFGALWPSDDSSCALGAAYDALGCGYSVPAMKAIAVQDAVMPRWLDELAQCPACSHRHVAAYLPVIGHLNDEHYWTREQIADWVATIEAQHEQPKDSSPAAVPVEA